MGFSEKKLGRMPTKIFSAVYSSYWRRKFRRCGSDFWIHRPAIINNPGKIEVGNHVCICEHAWLNCLEASKNEVTLTIHDGCYVGRFIHINAYGKVVLEENVLIADRVHISDCSHLYDDMNIPIMLQGAEFMGPVIIKTGAWLGVGSVILPGVTIGKNAVVAANAVVTQDVPDYYVARGVPAEVFPKRQQHT